MNWTVLIPVIAGLFGLMGVVVNRPHKQPSGRHRIKMDLEILELLPEGSTERSSLQERIESDLRRIIALESGRRRDPEGIFMGCVGLAASGALYYGASVSDEAWPWLAGGSYLAAGSVGFVAMSFRKGLRDVMGRSVAGLVAPKPAEKDPEA